MVSKSFTNSCISLIRLIRTSRLDLVGGSSFLTYFVLSCPTLHLVLDALTFLTRLLVVSISTSIHQTVHANPLNEHYEQKKGSHPLINWCDPSVQLEET